MARSKYRIDVGGRECVICKQYKLWGEFNRQKDGPQGFMCKCRFCCSDYASKGYQENRESSRERSRKWHKENRKRATERNRNWHQKNKEKRKENDKLHRRSKEGFLKRKYYSMKLRVQGRCSNPHLWALCPLLPKEDFFEWSNNNEDFHRLFQEWGEAGYPRKLCPSVDRVNPTWGYEIWNMEWVTQSENSRRAQITRYGGNIR